MNKAQITSLINTLEEIRERPMMWIGKETDIVAFINGFNTACSVLGGREPVGGIQDSTYMAVVAERGWRISSQGPDYFIREKGWNEQDIVTELLTIQIETWNRKLTNLDTDSATDSVPTGSH